MSRKKNHLALHRDRLKKMREKRGLTYQELADLSGISRRQLIRYETGDSEASVDSIARLAKALQCSADWLLGLVDNPTAITPDIPPEILRLARQFAALPQNLKDAIRAIIRGQPGGTNGE